MLHDQRFYVAVSFVLFFLIFGRKLWSSLAQMLDARGELIRRELDEASSLRREAEKMLEDAAVAREQALAEAQTLIEKSHKEAEVIAQDAQRKSQALLEHREAMAKDRIAAAERAVVAEIKEQATRAAIAAVRTLLSENDNARTLVQEKLMHEGLEALPRTLAPFQDAGKG